MRASIYRRELCRIIKEDPARSAKAKEKLDKIDERKREKEKRARIRREKERHKRDPFLKDKIAYRRALIRQKIGKVKERVKARKFFEIVKGDCVERNILITADDLYSFYMEKIDDLPTIQRTFIVYRYGLSGTDGIPKSTHHMGKVFGTNGGVIASRLNHILIEIGYETGGRNERNRKVCRSKHKARSSL